MKDLILALRPKQWTKNVFVLAALIFSKQVLVLPQLARTGLALVIFCFLASAGYLINDLIDLEKDKIHPVKSSRPLPAGKISIGTALFLAVFLGSAGIWLSYFLGWNFFYVCLFYLFLHIFYSIMLKEIVILDMLLVASFYVLRVIAGGAAISTFISPWLLVCTFFLALFIAVSKRRHELILLGPDAYSHRAVLKEYSPGLLDQMLSIVTPSTLVAYSLYTFTSGKSVNMIYTIPLVTYGLLRYLYLVYQKEGGGQPTEILLDDRPLQICILLWLVTSMAIFYYF